MRGTLTLLVLTIVAMTMSTRPTDAAKFKDSRGNIITIHLGTEAFADRVVTADNPSKLRAGIANPENALKQPNYKAVRDNGTYYSLGCKGSAVWEFKDNSLADVKGDDLYIFEVGPDIEPTNVAISTNGLQWLDLGVVRGGKASIDIAPVAVPGDVYRFVRLRDLGKACKSRSPGADIDALAASGGGITLRLDSSVLFDVDSDVLKSAAQAELTGVVKQIRRFELPRIVVTGHTDTDGSDAHNMALSQRRATSVVRYLSDTLGLAADNIAAHGRGESTPVATNSTSEGKARNRRVEITVIPSRSK